MIYTNTSMSIAVQMVIPAMNGEVHEEEVVNCVTQLVGRGNAVAADGRSRRRGGAEAESVLVA